MSDSENPQVDEVQEEEGAQEQAVAEEAVAENEAPAEETGEAAADVDVEQLQAELAACQEKINDLTDKAVRAQAEVQNMRRRAERDVENAHKFALEKFVKDLIAVLDSLERGIESVDENDEALKASREGMTLTLKMFTDVLSKYNVVEVNPVGEPFDPQLHEAMSMLENPDAEPNSVMTVLQKGYTLNERLVRPAMVVVAKAPAAPKEDS